MSTSDGSAATAREETASSVYITVGPNDQDCDCWHTDIVG